MAGMRRTEILHAGPADESPPPWSPWSILFGRVLRTCLPVFATDAGYAETEDDGDGLGERRAGPDGGGSNMRVPVGWPGDKLARWRGKGRLTPW